MGRVLQREADKHFAIIPDFIANCGMARTFAYLMTAGGRTDEKNIIADSAQCIDNAMDKLLAGYSKPSGLLERGYSVFVPE